MWEITEGEALSEIEASHLDLEQRLEDWLARDVSAIGEDLLVIGRQLQTDYGGIIDLLCVDRDGDLAILELKLDKTPGRDPSQLAFWWFNGLRKEPRYQALLGMGASQQ